MEDGTPPIAKAGEFLLRDLKRDHPDPRGRMVEDILWSLKEFKIYKTAHGISPFFSDDPEQAKMQKSAYLMLGADIAAFNHLINTLKPIKTPFRDAMTTKDHSNTGAIVHYERELARCIAQSFLCEKETAKKSLMDLRARLETKISNRARTVHLLINVILVFLLFMIIFILKQIGYTPVFALEVNEITLAALMGSIGALFSTTVRLQMMSVDPTIGQLMHWVYGSQRILVGALGAVIMYLGFKSGIISGLFQPLSETTTAPQAINPYWLAFVSVLAGFSERLVPNLLDGKDNEANEKAAPPPASADGEPGP